MPETTVVAIFTSLHNYKANVFCLLFNCVFKFEYNFK